MDTQIFLAFINNMLLLMSASVVYALFKNESKFHPLLRKFLMGLSISLIVLIVMYFSYEVVSVKEGIFIDTRAVILSISGMFFGFIPTIMGMITAVIYRLAIGGDGAPVGVMWIIASGALGLLWRLYRLKRNKLNKYKINWIELYMFGLIIQIVMVTLLLFLPEEVRFDTIDAVALPLLAIYPVGSLLVSLFMINQRNQHFSELDIHESDLKYRKLFLNNKSNLLLFHSETGQILDVNNTAIDTYGYSLEEFQSMNIMEINTLPKEKLLESMANATKANITKFQFQHTKKNGQIFDVEVQSGPVELNGITYLYSNVTDISEKVQNERMFKDSDDRLKATLLSVGEGIIVTDEFSRITIVNDKALKLLNQTSSLERKKVFEEFRIYSNQNDSDFESLYNNCISNNKMFRSDNTYSLLTSDDQIIFIDFTISPINNENGINHGAILVFRDVTVEKERQEEIRFMSRHDYLTGLFNRYNFESEMVRLNTPRQLPISIIIGDLNGLKLVNDTFGHLEGDKLIKEVSSIFKKATRSEDIVSRWGGDEFAILLPQTSDVGAQSVIDRIKDLCEKSMYTTITPSVAIGAYTKTKEEDDILEVLNAAEKNMYSNKLIEGPIMRQQLLDELNDRLNTMVSDHKSHSNNIMSLLSKYCKFYAFDQTDCNDYANLAKYHDIGRITIDNNILNKSTKLSVQEWTKIRSHPETGSRIVSTIPELQHLSKSILHHHENWDGSGYPLGLKGKNISKRARLLSIIDSYESMTNDRLYKDKKSHDEAVNELLKFTGTQFDPELVKAFINIFN